MKNVYGGVEESETRDVGDGESGDHGQGSGGACPLNEGDGSDSNRYGSD